MKDKHWKHLLNAVIVSGFTFAVVAGLTLILSMSQKYGLWGVAIAGVYIAVVVYLKRP